MTSISPIVYEKHFQEHMDTTVKTQSACFGDFEKLCSACKNALQNGNKILFFGNGGSAADAQHLATELTVRYVKNRKAMAALSLSTDTSALTAIGNDFSFDDIFSRQIEALGREGDVAIAISTSGKSENVIRALEQAQSQGMIPAALSGRDGGRFQGLADPLIVVPSEVTAHIQEMHITLGHLLCEFLESSL